VRVGENEAMFRDVNETVAAAAGSKDDSERITFLCECADEFCAEHLSLRLSEYEQIRAVPERFAVAQGHVLTEIERVIERHHDYWVVEKFGGAGEVAEETDPRAHE